MTGEVKGEVVDEESGKSKVSIAEASKSFPPETVSNFLCFALLLLLSFCFAGRPGFVLCI